MDGAVQLVISLDDILNLLGQTRRSLSESEIVLNANHVILCGVLEQSSNVVHIFSLCLQSSGIHDKPHEINIKIVIENNGEEKKYTCTCSCTAGAGGRCKHVFATLLLVNRRGIDHLDDLSCTDIKQSWGKLSAAALQQYDHPVRTVDLCHYNNPFKPDRDYSHLNDFFLETLIKGSPNSEAAIHMSMQCNTQCSNPIEALLYNESFNHRLILVLHLLKRPFKFSLPVPSSIDERCKLFYDSHVQLNEAGSCFTCLRTVYQCDELWKSSRRFRITGSVCYELFTYCDNKKANWESKIERIFFSKFKGSDDTDYGHVSEPKARELYQLTFKKYVAQLGFFCHPHVPWLGTSPDGIVCEDECLLEIKSPKFGKTMTAYEALKKMSCVECDKQTGRISFKKKHKFYGQIQLSLALLNLKKCHFVVYASFDNSIYVFEVLPDFEFINNMLSLLYPLYFNTLLPNFVAREKNF